MSIIRNQLNFAADFVQIPNAWLRDARLSHRARGILAEVMTHSDGWEITVQHLVNNGTEGRDAVRGAIRELVDAGYLRQVRVQDDSGRLKGSQYVTQIPPDNRETGYRATDYQAPGNPGAGKPGPWKSATKNTNSKNTNEKNTNTSGAADADAGVEISEAGVIEDPLPVAVEAKPPWDVIAQRAYDSTEGALPYMGTRGIAKWAIEKKSADPQAVEAAIAGLYRSGQAMTRQSVGQVLDGIRGTRGRDEYVPGWQKRLDYNVGRIQERKAAEVSPDSAQALFRIER